KLNLSKDGILNVQFSRPYGIGSSTVEVLNSAGSVIGSFSISLSNAQKNSINLNVKTGTYYIRIRPQKENPSVEYSLVAMFIESIKVSYLSSEGKEIISDPLKAGDKIIVEMKWDIKDGNGKAEFSIGEDDKRVVTMSQEKEGLYKGIYTIVQWDDISGQPIFVHITDNLSNEALIDGFFVGVVDSISPAIIEVSHDAYVPLSAGKTLSVRMIGEPRCKAKFDIVGFKNGLDMFNMASVEAKPPLVILNWDWKYDPTIGIKGAIVIFGEVKNLSDPTKDLVRINYTLFDDAGKSINSGFGYTMPNRIATGVTASFKIITDYIGTEKSAKIQLVYGTDQKVVGEVKDDYGVYTGIYEITENDNIQDAVILFYLTDIAGNRSSAYADTKITFDNIPPIITSITYNADKVFIEGDSITVKLYGEADCEATFDIGTFKTGILMSPIQGENAYLGTYKVKSGDKVSGALIIAHLKDKAGNTSTYTGTQAININTSTPSISSVSINNKNRPFIEGEVLIVTAATEIGATATFDIENLVSNRPMFDDGKHDDGFANDGVYTGFYIIKKGDNIRNAKVKINTLSPNGKASQRYALDTISIDTIPPQAVSGIKAIDKPNDEGGFIILSWTPSTETEFLEYRVYQSDQFITSVKGLKPLDLDLDDKNISSVEIKVDKPAIDSHVSYYFAVTVVDIATNESSLGLESTAGPVFSIDNLPPLPVAKVTGYDRKFDNGKVIVITWSQSSIAEDFNNYNIYIGQSPIDLSLTKRVPSSFTLVDSSITDRNVRIANITVPEDDVLFYFVVTAVDEFGNESDITEDSIVGPLSSKNDIGIEPDTLVKIISGPVGEINYNDVTFHWRRWWNDQSTINGYFYKLDDSNWIWTNEVSKTYRDLREGQHTFYVKADLGSEGIDLLPTVRVFSIKRISISEKELNNAPEQANWIAKGMTIVGTSLDNDDTDWYKFHVDSTSPALMTFSFDKGRGKGITQATVFKSPPSSQEAVLCSITVDSVNSFASFSTGIELGDYYIMVKSEGELPDTKYELTVTIEELSQSQNGSIVHWDKENNDLPLLSQIVGKWNFGTQDESNRPIEISGFGNKENDIDWYKIQITGVKPNVTTFLKIDFIRPKAIGSTNISVYASLPVTESPQIGFMGYSADILPVQTISMPVISGDYYIKVENLNNTSINSIYSIRLSYFSSSEKWEIEPNNLSQFANMLSIGEVIKGTNWDGDNDLDWYRVRLNERKILVVSMFKPFSKGTTEIILKSGDLADIANATASILSGQKATISVNLNVGDYYIVVKPSGEKDISAVYELTTTIIDTKFSTVLSDKEKTPDAPLTIGDSILLNVTWLPGNTITYDIGEIRTNLQMFDDGKNSDNKANDGIYGGIYV
ncbi:MAG: choice-of-anchor X domain-containing protein, partial [Candidatus Poribacteria bacterium]